MGVELAPDNLPLKEGATRALSQLKKLNYEQNNGDPQSNIFPIFAAPPDISHSLVKTMAKTDMCIVNINLPFKGWMEYLPPAQYEERIQNIMRIKAEASSPKTRIDDRSAGIGGIDEATRQQYQQNQQRAQDNKKPKFILFHDNPRTGKREQISHNAKYDKLFELYGEKEARAFHYGGGDRANLMIYHWTDKSRPESRRQCLRRASRLRNKCSQKCVWLVFGLGQIK